MQKFIPDVKMLLKLPNKAGIDYTSKLMVFLAKNVHGDLDRKGASGYDEHKEAFQALVGAMLEVIFQKIDFTRKGKPDAWLRDTFEILQRKKRLLYSYGVDDYFPSSIKHLKRYRRAR